MRHPLIFVGGAGACLVGLLISVGKLTEDRRNIQKMAGEAMNDPYQKLPVVSKTVKKPKEEEV